MKTHHSDVLVTGAGPAGAYVAFLLGQAGLSVVLLDKNSAGDTGAQWVNGIPLWMLEESGLGSPNPEEIHHVGARFTVMDPTQQARISISAPFLIDVDMRQFGMRLLKNAEESKQIRVLHDVHIEGLELDLQDRPIAALSKQHRFEAKLFIDASGLAGIIRKNVSYLRKQCPMPQTTDLCRAAQEVREVRDPAGVQHFLETHHIQPGEILSWVGIAGGFSILRVHIAADLRTINFLTGTRALFGVPSGARLIQRFVDRHSWVGSKMFGGQRAIPLRYPYGHLLSAGVALLGDSGCQVYSAHGSGIGIGLLAAKQLANTVIDAAKKGLDIGSLSALWPYGRDFHRNYAGLLVTSDLVRCFSQELSPYEVHQMIASGLMSGNILKSSLLQKHPELILSELPGQLKALFQAPGLAFKMGRMLSKFPQVFWTVRNFPEKPDWDQLLRYEQKLAQYFE